MGRDDELSGWLDEITTGGGIWLLKRLSANDTLANGSHQAGPYIPKQLLFDLFPEWREQFDANQKGRIRLTLDSHGVTRDVIATWYNNRHRPGAGTRDETRVTGFGGASSPLLDPESTGALAFFCFMQATVDNPVRCRVWLARSPFEEDRMEGLAGIVEPGRGRIVQREAPAVRPGDDGSLDDGKARGPCWLRRDDIPAHWLKKFPTGLEIVEHVLGLLPPHGLDPDTRIVRRRVCEEQAFYSVEEAVELEEIRSGFEDVESFMTKAKSMTQRRVSRSGRSLELHVRQIFEEEGLTAEVGYSWQPTTELGKKPDFLFPSIADYNDPEFPPENLRMLAVKTTCRDRWRQVINEADRVPRTHLLTLQEGVSERQFEEMQSEGVTLVVPASVHRAFNKSFRSDVMSFGEFIEEVRGLTSVS